MRTTLDIDEVILNQAMEYANGMSKRRSLNVRWKNTSTPEGVNRS